MSAARKRCVLQNCTNWEFQNGLCRPCSVKNPELAAAIGVYKSRPALQSNLIITQRVPSPYYLNLNEGDRVDIVDILADGVSVIVRSAAGDIGYWNVNYVMTEEQLYDAFRQQAEQSAIMSEVQKKEAQRRAEIEFEERLRQSMLQRAEFEKLQRQEDAARKKLEEEQRQRELAEQRRLAEERRRYEEEQARLYKQILKETKEAERLRLEEEARLAKAVFDHDEQMRKEQKLMASMPAWKRDLIMKKRMQDNY